MPSEIASWPLAESTSTFGRKLGDTRSGPRSRRISSCSRIPVTPPIAVPKTIPTRVGSKPLRPASPIASRAAPSASRTLRSSLRTSFGDATWVGSKSFTSAAIRTGSPVASNERIQSMPLRPATAAAQVVAASLPMGVTAPRPVTATRVILAKVTNREVRAHKSTIPSPGPSPRPETFSEVRDGGWHGASRAEATTAGLLPLGAVRALPTRRGLPRPGAAAPSQPRHVRARAGRGGGAPGPARALQDPDGADARRRRGPGRRRPPRAPARLPRDRGLPRSLAQLGKAGVRPPSRSDPVEHARSRVSGGARTERSVSPDGGAARQRAARDERLAVRAEVGRLPRRARERRRRARALVAERSPAAPLLPGAPAARRPAAASLRARR